MRNRMGVLAAAAVLTAAGCLVGDRTHTLYLDPDGSVTWSVLERHVRSDEAAAANRDREEAEYLERAREADQPIARGLRELDPLSLRTEVLRGERPFAVASEARFPSAPELLQRLLDGLGLPGRAEMRRDGDRMRLTLTVDPGEAGPDASEVDDDLVALVAEADDSKIVLTRGRFVEAVGFRLSDDRVAATPIPQEVGGENPAPVVYSLVWSVE